MKIRILLFGRGLVLPVLARLSAILAGKADGEGSDHLGDSERERIANIFAETLPEGWRE